MCTISTREFRSNQSRYLQRALSGEPVTLTSRLGEFQIVPIREKSENLTDRIVRSLKNVKLIEDGILPSKSALDFLDEL